MDDVAAFESGTSLMCHGVDDAKEGVGKCHAGETLGIVHAVPFFHISLIGFYQILLDHFNGVKGKRICVVAVCGGYIGLDGMGHGIHTSVGNQLLGHCLSQFRVYDSDIRCDLKIGDRIFYAFLIICDNRECRYLCRCP